MDTQTFGAFIAQCRKEKGLTQAELADRLHLTDKAVSRWERGIGYPDIATLEPLAGALGITILELMRSCRLQEEELKVEQTETVLKNTLELVKIQRKKERRAALSLLALVAAADLLILLLDTFSGRWDALLMLGAGVFFPLFCATGALALMGLALWRRSTGRPWGQTARIALALALGLALLCGVLLLAGALGLGPVPN